ncbi:MAG: hypothetical protein AB1502_09720 [Thermodesulfobacteriota bacterium]
MHRKNQEEGRYRVLLISIGDNTEEKKEFFCKNISENFGIELSLLRKIVDRCPIILKKNLSLKKSEILANTLKAFGAVVSVEKKYDFPPIFLEFQEMAPYRVALESSYLRRTQSGAWNVVGRVKNIFSESLNDTWVLIQLFDAFDEFITFEEIPLPINPLPPGEVSPFKLVFEGGLPVQRITVAFKNSLGYPLPAIDRRKKREWVEIEIREGGEKFISSAFLSPRGKGGTRPMEITEPPEEMLLEKSAEIQMDHFQSLEPESSPLPIVEDLETVREGEEKGKEEPLLLKLDEIPLEVISESIEQTIDFTLKKTEEDEKESDEASEKFIEEEPIPMITLPVSEEETEEEAFPPEWEGHHNNSENIFQETHLDLSPLKEATQLLEEISVETGEVEAEEEPPLFPWMGDFRNAIENYYQKPRDMFSMWFDAQQKEEGFANPLHSLLTILIHARFDQGPDQMNHSGKALENTQRAFRLIIQTNLSLEEIPPLEGTPFFSGESWRDLFRRAIPRLQQIANNIIEKKKWNAPDLERLVRVIPHMSNRNSRKAIRWINELIPDVVEIDFSNTPLLIGESLYRVASRLGVVDPHFDHYQGRNSMGDLKIQSFAKATFPQDPVKVEEPMIWVGMKEEEGGHCFPTQPQCEGCLFETFCSRLFLHFNPSVKGMRSD